MKKRNIIFILLIIFIIGCTSTVEKQSKTIKEPSPLEIYLVKPMKDGQDLKTVELQEQPILTLKDIKSYDWETHTIEVTDEYISKRQRELEGTDNYGSKVLGTKANDNFILVVNGEKICSGGFKPFILSKFNQPNSTPNIIDLSNNKIKIDFHPLSSFRLGDQRLYDVLKDHGKFLINDKTLKEAVSQYAMLSSTMKYHSRVTGRWSTSPLATTRINHSYVVFAKDAADTISYSIYTLNVKNDQLSLASAVNSPIDANSTIPAIVRQTEVQVAGKPYQIIYGILNSKFLNPKENNKSSINDPLTLKIMTDNKDLDFAISTKDFFIVPIPSKDIKNIQLFDQKGKSLGLMKNGNIVDFHKH